MVHPKKELIRVIQNHDLKVFEPALWMKIFYILGPFFGHDFEKFLAPVKNTNYHIIEFSKLLVGQYPLN